MTVTKSHKKKSFSPENRPFLANKTHNLDLVYLSWGKRYYGHSTIPITLHEGWVYMLITAGSPTLMSSDKRPTIIKHNHLVLLGPHFASGWSDTKMKSCEQMSWVWKESPIIPVPTLPLNAYYKFSLSQEITDHLVYIHTQCRKEVASPDELSAQTLKMWHRLMDNELSRLLRSSPSHSTRFSFALTWLERNWKQTHAVTKLSEYLQLSLSSLNKLFKNHLGIAPAEWIHRKKMETAAQLLHQGHLSKKQIAFELGYRYPNDFSRAWHRWKKNSPSPKSSRPRVV